MKKILIALVLLGLSPLAVADFLAFGCNINVGSTSTDSEITSINGDNGFALEDELGLESPSVSALGCFLEHPLPILPNVAFATTSMSSNNSKVPTSAVVFMGESFDTASSSNNEFDYGYNDLDFYWQPLPDIVPIVSLNLGLTMRSYSGEISMGQQTTSASLNLDHDVPLALLGARLDIPVVPIYLSADYRGGSYPGEEGDISVSDTSLELGYNILLGFGVALGTNSHSLEVDADGSSSSDYAADLDLGVNSSYLKLYYRF